MTMYMGAENVSGVFPYVETLTDDEVKKNMENHIKGKYPGYRIIEWNANDVPMGFGRRYITCKFEVN